MATNSAECRNEKLINIRHIAVRENVVVRERAAASRATLRAGQCLCVAGVAEGGGRRVVRVERGGQRGRKLDVGQVGEGTAGAVGCWF